MSLLHSLLIALTHSFIHSRGRAKKGKAAEGVGVDGFSWRMAKEAVGLPMSYLKGLAQNHIGSATRSGEWSNSGQWG